MNKIQVKKKKFHLINQKNKKTFKVMYYVIKNQLKYHFIQFNHNQIKQKIYMINFQNLKQKNLIKRLYFHVKKQFKIFI